MGQLEVVGGPYYIAQLTSRVGSAANIEFHCKILLEMFLKREMIRISSDIITRSFDPAEDVFDIMADTERHLFEAAKAGVSRNNIFVKDLVPEVLENAQKASKGDVSLGIPSGFPDLDRITGGWKGGNLIIVAGRPGMGKTAFGVNCARNASVEYKIPTAVFSLEMESIEITQRLVSGEAKVEGYKLRTGGLSPSEWDQLAGEHLYKLSNAPLIINDTPALSVFDFRTIARRLKHGHGIGLIVIDYLQLMTGDRSTRGVREQEISMISRMLKATAKELSIPIITLSQLSRETEKRSDKRPQLSDLRESGAIEQDADLVIFPYRPGYYDKQNNDGTTEIIIAKNRHGKTGAPELIFNDELTRFENPPAGSITAEPTAQYFTKTYRPVYDDNPF
jgi:replicative DNA helicase